MNAQELFKMAYGNKGEKHRNGSRITPSGLSVRTYNTLRRANIANRDGVINVVVLRQAIMSGDILLLRNCGKKTVMEICEWLAAQQPLAPDASPQADVQSKTSDGSRR